MKSKTTIETTKTIDLTAQDIIKFAQDNGLIPKEWKFWSAEIEGKGISNGGTLTIRHSETLDS